jgi:hypothetical protein
MRSHFPKMAGSRGGFQIGLRDDAEYLEEMDNAD